MLLAADPSEVTRLNAWLDKTFDEAGVEESVRSCVKLCLNEAVTNVILYGMADRPDPVIEVDVEADPHMVISRISDNGTPFNPLEWPEKPAYTNLEEAVPGGFGIHLLRESASGLAYERDGEWNRLAITCGKSG